MQEKNDLFLTSQEEQTLQAALDSLLNKIDETSANKKILLKALNPLTKSEILEIESHRRIPEKTLDKLFKMISKP